MRPRSSFLLLTGLGLVALTAGACNLVFGIDAATPGSTSAGGAGGAGGLPSTVTSTATGSGGTGGTPEDGGPEGDAASDHQGDTGGAGGSGGGGPSCTPNTTACDGTVLHACDGTGKLTTTDCLVLAACDAAAGKCLAADPYGYLSVGQALACVIEDDAARTVRCWGANDGAQLIPTDPRGIVPTAEQVQMVSGVRQVAVGTGQQCVLRDDGSVVCWGATNSGEGGVLGCGNIPPMKVANLPTALEVRVAERCSCARLTDGTVDCWGDQATGCFGTASHVETATPTPQQVPGVTGAVALRVGAYSTPSCALLASGKVQCWDPNNPPTDVGVTGATDIAIGGSVVFIRTTSLGVVWTAPSSDSGPGYLAPVKYEGVGQLTAMAAGDSFCDLQPGGIPACAVFNDPPFPSPMPLTGLPAVAEIAAGSSYPAAYDVGFQCLRLAGKPIASAIYCWGDDGLGEIGIDAPENITAPTAVMGLAGTAFLSTGQASTSVVLATGAVSTWGGTDSLLSMEEPTPTPVAFLGTSNAKIYVNDADEDAYVLESGGSLQLYNAMTLVPNARLNTSGFTDFVDAHDFSNWDVGRRSGGTLVLYANTGDANQAGIFGDGTTVTTMAGVTPTVPLTGVTDLAAYGDDNDSYPAHVCALVAGSVSCWGTNEAGEVGSGTPADGATVNTPTVVSIPGGDPIVSLATGRFFTCAAGSSGEVYCWGANDRGQLGVLNAQDGPTPVAVTGLGSALSVSAREAHVCARLSNNTVACWGANDHGQIGNGTLTDQPVPFVVPNLTNVAAVSVGTAHTCVRLTGGSVQCWGSSYNGQVGSGVTGFYPSPQPVRGL